MSNENSIVLRRSQVEEVYAHAREASPAECCGLIGGVGGAARTIYRLRNVSPAPRAAYEAAPEDLFAAQQAMRSRGEQLLGIYHSHPRSPDPAPSEADVRLAYYPAAVYFIIGFAAEGSGVLRAFRISESEGNWERVSFDVTED